MLTRHIFSLPILGYHNILSRACFPGKGQKQDAGRLASLARRLGDDHLKTALWQEFMSDEPYKDTLHFLNCHIYVLDHSSVEHSRRHIPPPTLLLQVIETLQNDTFPMGETVSDIKEIVTRVTAMHVRFSPWAANCAGSSGNLQQTSRPDETQDQ
jgi:hypothetical protein